MKIDDINPSENIIMTRLLIRLFKAEGCSPTVCHACHEPINIGDVFKLVTHPKTGPYGEVMDGEGQIDEMCCGKCGSYQLKLRDRILKRNRKNQCAEKIAQGGHGFSRVSKIN